MFPRGLESIKVVTDISVLEPDNDIFAEKVSNLGVLRSRKELSARILESLFVTPPFALGSALRLFVSACP